MSTCKICGYAHGPDTREYPDRVRLDIALAHRRAPLPTWKLKLIKLIARLDRLPRYGRYYTYPQGFDKGPRVKHWAYQESGLWGFHLLFRIKNHRTGVTWFDEYQIHHERGTEHEGRW